MADNTFTFGTYVKPEKVNPYAEVVAQLAAASEENPTASVSFEVPVEKAQNEEFKFRKAANAIDKTASLVNKDESRVKVKGKDEDGNDVLTGPVTLTFIIGKRHAARRGPKPVVEGSESK